MQNQFSELLQILRDQNFPGQQGMREQAARAIEQLVIERDELVLMRDGLIDIMRRINPFAAKSRGGSKGGIARMQALSPERRSEIARDAANTRWNETPSA